MGKRHNTLDYKYFHKTRYIKDLEKKTNISNFKKEYLEQFNIMYDIFRTLINVNNIIFSDSDKTPDDKVFELELELEKCVYGDNDNTSNIHKYSVRTIKDLISIEPKRIYNNFIEWYSYIQDMGVLGNIPEEIEKIMLDLEEYGFDDIINDNIAYKANKNSKQRLFLSKFFKYNCNEKYLNEYLDDYFNKYIETLSRDKIKKEICFIFDLVAKANNGIVRKTNNFKDTITKKNIEEYDFILDYFDTLNIKITENPNYSSLKEDFINEHGQIWFFLNLYDIGDFPSEDLTSKEIYANFDLYSFVICMYQISNNLLTFKTQNPMLLKIIEELKSVYNNILENNYDLALKQTLKIISNHNDVFIKIS